jgi:hypothetical protein
MPVAYWLAAGAVPVGAVPLVVWPVLVLPIGSRTRIR